MSGRASALTGRLPQRGRAAGAVAHSTHAARARRAAAPAYARAPALEIVFRTAERVETDSGHLGFRSSDVERASHDLVIPGSAALDGGSRETYDPCVDQKLATKLAVALEEVGAADKALTDLLAQIRVAPRAEKTAVSDAVADALAKLQVATTNLLELQALVDQGQP